MKQSTHKKLYAAEVAATFIASLGMMLLIVVSAAGVFLTVVQADENDPPLGVASIPTTASAETLDAILLAAQGEGVVAGVVDDASIEEKQQQNKAAEWYDSALQNADLIEVRSPYRDSVLDRSAQNFARSLADSCNLDVATDWSDQIGVKIDEGYIESYSEAVFIVANDSQLNADLPTQADAYQRLFLNHEAYGVGAASIPESTDCGGLSGNTIITFHLATIN